MKLTLIENGLDSLRKGYESLNTYDKIVDSAGTDYEKSIALKGAIIHIHHGVEILMKQILSKQSEYLILSNIDNNIKKAYKEKNQRGLASVFETSVIDKVHTVTYEEAFERLSDICNHTFSNSFKEKIKLLNSYRNRITHAEITIADEKITTLFDGFIDELDLYFFKQIGLDYKTMSGYSDLITNYESYKKWLLKNGKLLKAKVIDTLTNTFTKVGINMGINEVKRIQDIDVCTKFFKELYSQNFKFGTDLYNGTCSGDVTEIKRIDQNHFSMYCKDNNGEEIFKFKSLIIYNPKYQSNFSPIFIFESDEDNELSEEEEIVKISDYSKEDTYIIEGLKISGDSSVIIDERRLSELQNRIDNDDYIDFEYHFVRKHLSRCIFAMINIQGLNYGGFDDLIYRFYQLDGETLVKELSKAI